jgi:Fe-S-cluster containining protein
MISIDCTNCKKHCCGEIRKLRPVLLPSEEKRFKKYSDIVKMAGRDMLVLKQKKGNCIFFNKKKKCIIYTKRPLECRLYPFLLDFSKKQANVKLDKRFCKSLKTLAFDKRKIISYVRKHKFPREWVKEYKKMDKY